MLPQAVFALLSDAGGSVLLVRRRGGFLLGLPGGDIRGAGPLEELLVTFCTRQVGVIPDFAPQFSTFTLAGRTIAIGFAEIVHSRAGARGRIEASFWTRPDKLPPEIDPIARFAVALERQEAGRRLNPTLMPERVVQQMPGLGLRSA